MATKRSKKTEYWFIRIAMLSICDLVLVSVFASDVIIVFLLLSGKRSNYKIEFGTTESIPK